LCGTADDNGDCSLLHIDAWRTTACVIIIVITRAPPDVPRGNFSPYIGAEIITFARPYVRHPPLSLKNGVLKLLRLKFTQLKRVNVWGGFAAAAAAAACSVFLFLKSLACARG
jgi:hypothetical protein